MQEIQFPFSLTLWRTVNNYNYTFIQVIIQVRIQVHIQIPVSFPNYVCFLPNQSEHTLQKGCTRVRTCKRKYADRCKAAHPVIMP